MKHVFQRGLEFGYPTAGVDVKVVSDKGYIQMIRLPVGFDPARLPSGAVPEADGSVVIECTMDDVLRLVPRQR